MQNVVGVHTLYPTEKKAELNLSVRPFHFYSGSYLLSHTVARAVPSAQEGLTSVFGMGTGGSPPIQPPENLITL
jgi:hypothetical protein